MKINEIINEGPMDWVKQKAAAVIPGRVKSAVDNYQQNKAAKAQNTANAAAAKPINDATKRLITDWTALTAQMTANGNPVNIGTFASWMKQRTPSVAPPVQTDIATPQSTAAYITKAVSQHFANRAAGQSTVSGTATSTTPATAAKPSVWKPVAGPGGAMSGGGTLHSGAGPIYSRDVRGNWLRLADTAVPPAYAQESYPAGKPQAVALEKLKRKLEVGHLPTESVQR